MTIPLSLYVHIPWCVQKCPYCDFNSHAIKEDPNEHAYVTHLLRDLDHDADPRPLESIFIGGGTPSVFSAQAIGALLDGIVARMNLAEDCEITLEANPGTFEQAKFRDYRAAGINRLSIGVQSFNPEHLQRLGRIHSGDEAERAVRIAQQAGFTRINTDIMFALPQQSIDQALADLRQAIALNAEHLSWYQLTIEPNTAFYANPPTLPSEDRQIEIYERGGELLREHGFEQYETSAWTRGAPSRHNLNYWQFGDYLGIGAGAHGKRTLADRRILRNSKYRAPTIYQTARGTSSNPYQDQQHIIEPAEQPFELMMNALRLRDGIPSEYVAERSQLTLDDLRPTLKPLITQGLIEADIEHRLCTTPRGFALLNNVLEAFLP
ncbi:radical SAM family heme chaperone HemW [Suttonella sp. R2A3]|uniref:radical SAM family heme chaperone HemW n=1 Tax=Suttonella sp. R2A3 TaxID=2908648 RepID=UPI001F1E50FB|nr:radical SAM family heme chaperone HemW [Suttonella sp. R2A3]UJF25339.1 radical SAM family heme chaperone HemW [Suttonella sp. R2A3]